MPIRRIVLLGYMLSGKSTVAEALARRLGWGFADFDVEIERREGSTVARIVADKGEEYFRSLEARLTDEVADVTGIVVAPGGGWITRPEMLARMGGGTLSVWLRVSADETVRRMMTDDIERPLRDHPEPEVVIRQMLEEREPLYRRADLMVPGDGRSVEEVAFEIEQVARTRGVMPRPPSA